MREVLVTELAREILGPSRGIYETLFESPLNEYITGVLAPILDSPSRANASPDDILDNQAEIPVEGVRDEYEEDKTDDVDVDVPSLFSPSLDPKSRPPSIGISFILQSSEIPSIELCVTWARYIEAKQGEKIITWKREPRSSIIKVTLNNERISLYLDSTGKQVRQGAAEEVSLDIAVRNTKKDRYFITIYLVNRVKIKNEIPKADEHIFQPQIRVICDKDAKIVPGLRPVPKNDEEEKLEFLYRERPVLARGHICSAMWHDIDPELPLPAGTKLDYPERRDDLLFSWLDGHLLQEKDRTRFIAADVRTEFVPLHPVIMPVMEWQSEFGTPPEMAAANLAELWDPAQLRSALSPLADSYQRWIDSIGTQAQSFQAAEKEIAAKLVNECRTVLQRIRSGIDILCTDDDARLSFCFANKSMDIQSSWAPRRKGLVWRPFQLAFILTAIESIHNPASQFREVCDLLWVPTGAGKTEAYFGVVAFAFSLRRRRSLKNTLRDRTGAGVSVITRYTLRLLTIQQFRRALAVLTACEYLRIENLTQMSAVGWRPKACSHNENFLWGSTPFSIGLWVGGEVAPNHLKTRWAKTSSGRSYPLFGAIEALRGNANEQTGEPAQVLACPACESILAVPEMGLQPGNHTLHFVIDVQNNQQLLTSILEKLENQTFGNAIVTSCTSSHHSRNYYTITVALSCTGKLRAGDVDSVLWNGISSFLKNNGCENKLVPVRASRSGYFLRHYVKEKGGREEYDFDIYCANPKCGLVREWCAGAPLGWIHDRKPDPNACQAGARGLTNFPDGNYFIDIQEPFESGSHFISDRIPIPALTVDQQIYHRLPTMIVATVDKFARPAFEPKAAALFGNIEYYHCVYGYYRQYQHYSSTDGGGEGGGHPGPVGKTSNRNYVKIRSSHQLEQPDLILQDELHLIEGPLGSLTGAYETAIDFLSKRKYPVKYIASTATIRSAEEQVRAVFGREVQLFPPHGLSAEDRFFIKERTMHPLEDGQQGRLYMGICAPGRGPLTPIVRIWSRLLQTAFENQNDAIDPFWTLTGYFNAVRELAGAKALYRQDIPQRIRQICGNNSPRGLPDDNAVELSSRTKSTDLPSILDILSNRSHPNSGTADSLFTTSMFGTGVDISRIGLMVVNGQPKTTSAYIQSTGRVGRSRGALVVTFYRASRPRDLSHYEFFCGYHSQIHRFVEPVTVYPFAPGVLDRTLGPVGLFILRNMRNATVPWDRDDSATLISKHRNSAREVAELPRLMEARAGRQPDIRRPQEGVAANQMKVKLDAWWSFAERFKDLEYVEYAISTRPTKPVVLGDSQHIHANLAVVYDRAPQSLRDVEETTGFET